MIWIITKKKFWNIFFTLESNTQQNYVGCSIIPSGSMPNFLNSSLATLIEQFDFPTWSSRTFHEKSLNSHYYFSTQKKFDFCAIQNSVKIVFKVRKVLIIIVQSQIGQLCLTFLTQDNKATVKSPENFIFPSAQPKDMIESFPRYQESRVGTRI